MRVDDTQTDGARRISVITVLQEQLAVYCDPELWTNCRYREAVVVARFDRERCSFQFGPVLAVHLAEHEKIRTGNKARKVPLLGIVAHRGDTGAKEEACIAFAIDDPQYGTRFKVGDVQRVEEQFFSGAVFDRASWCCAQVDSVFLLPRQELVTKVRKVMQRLLFSKVKLYREAWGSLYRCSRRAE